MSLAVANRCAEAGVNIITKNWSERRGSVTVGSLWEHRDRGDTYNGQFFTSGPLIGGVLGMKAYIWHGESAKDEAAGFRHHCRVRKRRALKDLPAGWKRRGLHGRKRKSRRCRRLRFLIARDQDSRLGQKPCRTAKTTRVEPPADTFRISAIASSEVRRRN